MRISRWSIRRPEGLEEGVQAHRPEHVIATGEMVIFHDDLRSVSVWLDDDGWDALGSIVEHRAYDRLAPDGGAVTVALELVRAVCREIVKEQDEEVRVSLNAISAPGPDWGVEQWAQALVELGRILERREFLRADQ